MGLWNRLFSTKKTNYNPLSFWKDIPPERAAVDMATAFANTVFICVNMRAETFANVINYVVTVDNEGGYEKVPNDHWLAQFITRPNPDFTWKETKKLLQMWLDYTGNAYLYINSSGYSLVLPSTMVTIRISSKPGQLIESYVLTMDGIETVFQPDEVCHFKTMYPSSKRENNFWSGSPGLLNAAAKAINADDSMIEFVLNYFENDAVPPFVLLAEKGFTQAEGERFKQQWGRAMAKYPIKGILESGKDVKPLNTGSGQAASVMSNSYDEMIQKTIVGIYGIPYSKFTSNYDNRNAAQTVEGVFRADTIEPRLNYFEEQLSLFFSKREPDLLITHDPYVYTDAEFDLRKRNEDLIHGRQTLNDQRREDGNVEVEGGDAVFVPTSVTTLGKLLSEPVTEIEAEVPEEEAEEEIPEETEIEETEMPDEEESEGEELPEKKKPFRI